MTRRRPGGDVDLRDVVSRLQEHTGLRLDGEHQLARIRAVLAERARRSSTTDGGEDTFERLISAVAVGESYFFREPRHLALLRSRIIPGLLGERPADHQLRVWSAGCAAGEEPYTLAIVLEQAGLADRSAIVGSDISREALGRAREAIYAEWSLRSLEEEERQRWFRRTPRGYALDERFKDRVDLRVMNLTAVLGTEDPRDHFDVIFCRNVLVHLTPDGLERAVRRLSAALAPGGWLVTGAGDPPLSAAPGLEAIVTEAGVVHRKVGLDARPQHERSPATACRTRPLAGVPRVRTHEHPTGRAESRTAARGTQLQRDVPGEETGAGPATPAAVRSLLDAGDLADAESLARRSVEDAPFDAERHLVLSTVLLASSDHGGAATAARAAAYLDPDLAVAHLTLGLLEGAAGNASGARRSFRTARRLLAAMEADEVVPASGGERAGRLLELAVAHVHRTSQEVR